MSKILLRTSIIQGFLESGWTEEALKKSLSKEEQHYLPTTSEFAGIIGKSYLNALGVRILPSRLYSTWSSLMNSLVLAQYNEKSLDLSELIAESAAGQSATLQKHVSTLQERSLATIQMDCRGTKHLKDFAGLYVLASEYHAWDESEEYIAPKAELVESIRQRPFLVAKLRRFDNYRRLLYKGIKPQKLRSRVGTFQQER